MTSLFILLIYSCYPFYVLYFVPLNTLPNSPVIINFSNNSSAFQLVQSLKELQLIHSPKPLLSFLKYTGLSQKLKAGIYEIKPGESAVKLMHRISSGDVVKSNFKIIAGTTQLKITQDLKNAPYLTFNDQSWKSIQENHYNAEGMVLADTYQYPGGATSDAILNKAHHNLISYLNQVWNSRDQRLPYVNSYELLIAASIIEKEAAIATERQLISGVIINRLRLKMPLQMDPTIIYAMGLGYKGKLSHQDMQIDSAYNSYRYRGLPPTPIAMVGKEALDAAAHPKNSNFLYYVAKGDGTHQFSETYEQQKHAIHQFQYRNRSESP